MIALDPPLSKPIATLQGRHHIEGIICRMLLASGNFTDNGDLFN